MDKRADKDIKAEPLSKGKKGALVMADQVRQLQQQLAAFQMRGALIQGGCMIAGYQLLNYLFNGVVVGVVCTFVLR